MLSREETNVLTKSLVNMAEALLIESDRDGFLKRLGNVIDLATILKEMVEE